MRYPGFYDYFFMEQHFRRFAAASFNNIEPFWFFIVVLPVLTLPWSARLPALRRLRTRGDPQIALYAWWVIAVVFFFSLPSSKIVGYVLPALPAWCALLAFTLHDLGARPWRWMLGGSAALCLAIVLALAWRQPRADLTIAHVLARQMAPADRVVMLDQYYYDVPFYARLKEPVIVLSDWADPALDQRDNWRKELHDAARFDPALAARVLLPLTELRSTACGSGMVWYLGRHRNMGAIAQLPGARSVVVLPATELWKAPAPACP